MKDPYVVAVGRRLDTTMKVFGIPTARRLAEFLGLERTQVSNWYNGVGLPRQLGHTAASRARIPHDAPIIPHREPA